MGDAADPAVFVFDRDGRVSAFPSTAAAAGHMESVDVVDGEYEAIFTLDGVRVTATARLDGPVTLKITDAVDQDGLGARLARCREQGAFENQTRDVAAVANELLRRAWERQWPRRPRWLAARLHGVAPPQV